MKIFDIVAAARNEAVKVVQDRIASGQTICGYQVDDACRGVIEKAGDGSDFIHRTGHSIGPEIHWKGANIDNFETCDERRLIEGLVFSIEPGIYLPRFGVRSELNMYISDGQAHVSGLPMQGEIIALLR